MEKITSRSMPIRPASFDPALRSVRAVVATEVPTEVWDWEQGIILNEVLLASGMELPPGRTQVPLLDSHSRFSVEDQLGSVRDFAVEGAEVTGSVFFDSTEDGQSAATKVGEGHVTDLSAGYIVLERYYVPAGQKAMIGGQEFEGPVKVCTRWQIKEVSVTPIGADVFSTFRSEKDHEIEERITRRINEVLSARDKNTTNRGDTPMPEETKPTGPSADEVRQQAQVAERARVSEINAIAKRHGDGITNIGEMVTKAIEDGTTPEAFWAGVRAAIPAPKPAAIVVPDTPAIELVETTPNWKKRASAILQVMTARAMGSSKLSEYQRGYQELVASFGGRAVEQEKRDALEIIKSAKLPRLQEERTLSIAGGGSTGEYALPAPFLAELFVIIEQYGAARRYFRGIPMPSKTLDLATISTKPTAAWGTEATNTAASDPAFGTGQLAAEKLVGITSWSSELDEDSAIALLPTLQMLTAEAVFLKEDAAGFVGDGTASYGSFTGMMNVATAGVTLDPGKVFADLTADDLKSVRDALSVAKRNGARWFMHPDILSTVEGLKDLQGRYIFSGPANGRPASIWGYPVEEVEAMPALSDSGASKRFVVFGNPQWMLMGTRRGLDVMVSREGILNTAANNISFNALQADGAILRVTERVAFKGPLGAAFSYLKSGV